MPVVPAAKSFDHIRRALRSKSTHVVVGDDLARVAVAGLAAGLVPLVLSQTDIHVGRFGYVAHPGAPQLDIAYATFPARLVARDTLADLLARHGVQLPPPVVTGRAELVVLSDDPARLLFALSRVVGGPTAQHPVAVPIARPGASYASPALAV